MGTLRERLHDDVEQLRQRRDELRVQVDPGEMEAADAWRRLEGKLRLLAGESKGAAEDVGKAVGPLVDEIREGFVRVARHL